MSLRKQIIKEATNVPTEIIIDDNSQESVDDRDGTEELSSSTRHRRRRERENQTKPKEMTEEEMMDLALRLSEQEASNTALQLQREEEAVMKAIQESMVGQTQPCPPSQSQSLLAHASLRLCSRRKLLRSNGMRTSSIDQGASEDVCTPEIDLTRETKGAGEEIKNRSKKRKRKEGSPPLKTSDFSQKIDSQASSGSSEPLDSQSSDSVQVDDRLLRKSPVFLSNDCKALVQIPRLSQDLLETCRSSGFVLCSQDTSSPQTSLPAETKSPTFPRSPGNLTSCPKSPVFSETVQGDDDETQLTQSLEYLKSPVFGKNTERETTPSACKPLVSVCENSGLEFSSQETLTSSVRTTSCRPQSPVFPRSPALPPPPGKSSICSSPIFSETHRGAAQQSHGSSSSPVFGSSGRKLSDDEPKTSAVPSEVERSNSEVSRAVGEESSQRPTQSCNTDPHQDDVRLNMISAASLSDDSQETPEDLNAAELTSDMVLVWSDKDEDITPACSPSPVFSEERGAGLADVQVSSLNHDTAASPGAEWRSSSTEEELQPAEGACAPPAVGPTVHYYWGVPFCPRGLDPDAYTQVILAQMDVYDKSLKQAQRRLLRKAPWGGAILPQPEKSPSPEPSAESPQRLVPRRRGLRLKKNNQSEESPPAEEEEEGGEQRDGEEEEEAEKETEGGEGEEGRMDSDDCDVCPETQLSNNDDDETQVLAIDSRTELQPESPDLPEVQKIPRDDSPAVVEAPPQEEEEMEVDAAVCGTMEGNIPVSGGDAAHKKGEEIKEDDVDPEVDGIKVRGLQRPTSPEVDPVAIAPSPEASVDCPICQGSFPVTKIEWHAAYCDGEVAVLDERAPEVSSKPRRKRRRADVTEAEETNDSVNSSRNQEKCFICQKNVPLREYTRHTELCIHRRPPKPDTRGNLLSALEQTENRGSEAGPSGTRIQPGEVIDLRDDDDDDDEEEEGVRALSVSNSPIRSFTPISEAAGCLIDFRRQQRAKKPSHRRR